MTSREAILNRIRTALAKDAPVPTPPAPDVWPDTQPSVDAMADRFTNELHAVSGEVVRCATLDEARTRLAQLLGEIGASTLAAMDRPLCRDLASPLGNRVTWPDPQSNAKTMADLQAGLLQADYLLADTGSAMIACATAQERLLCYLPPCSIIVAQTNQLVEHMPAAWQHVAPRVADPDLRGEFVFITGPSRTADIEKILILGVHGPKRVIVLLIG